MSAEPISLQELHLQELLLKVRDEARQLSRDALDLAASPELWLVPHMQATEERHQYAADEDPV